MKKTLLILFLFCSLASQAHKFYASITEVNYNPSSESLEVILKFFVDDFEEAVFRQSDVNLNLGTDLQHKLADSLVADYVNNGFYVANKNKTYENEYIGFESDKDYVWIYVEIKKFKAKGETQIKNSLLTELYPQQSNQINFNFNASIKTNTTHKDQLIVSF